MRFDTEADVEQLLRSHVSNDAARAFNVWLAEFEGTIYQKAVLDDREYVCECC